MRPIGTITLCCTVWLLSACTKPGPSLVPLGRGDLSRAEQEREAQVAQSRRNESPKANAPTVARSTEPEDKVVDASSNRDSSSHDREKPSSNESVDAKTSAKDTSTPSAAGQLEAWLGLYRGRDTTTFVMPEQPDRRFDDPKAKIRVESSRSNRIEFALIDTSNEKDICKLSASVSGDTASIDAGQACFLESDEEMTVKSRPGKATRKERHLTFDLVLDTIMETEYGDSRGTIEYHFEGDR